MLARPADQQTHLQINETPVQFDPSGALWLPREQILVFSDLHFEKGSSYGRKGLFLPPYDTRRTLKTMTDVISRWQPATVISLGDAFHDTQAEARMDAADMTQLQALTEQADWIWVLGNHDPAPPKYLQGKSCAETVLDGLHFSHEPCAHGTWQIAGHMHPAAKVSRDGRVIRRRCFMSDGARLILPSLGAYTGGLNVLDEAYKPFFGDGYSAFLLGQTRVWQVRTDELKPDGENKQRFTSRDRSTAS